jgi:hypothetical protein
MYTFDEDYVLDYTQLARQDSVKAEIGQNLNFWEYYSEESKGGK